MTVVTDKKGSAGEVRWSVRRKTDAVMRLLRGEDLDTVARELRVEAHRLAAWREEFMAAGAEGLKARPTDPSDRKLREAERQIGKLTMELEVWQAAGRKRGLQIPPKRRPR
jgi:transposase